MNVPGADWPDPSDPGFRTGPRGRKGLEPRVPPHNIEAEASLLGAMLLARDAIADALEVVRAEHFYKPSHAHVFDAVRPLRGRGTG